MINIISWQEYFWLYLSFNSAVEKSNDFSLESLLLIMFFAFIVPIIALRIKKIQIPVIVCEILVGIIIGKSGFNIINSGPLLEFLAFFGFAFLMFLSGLEIDFDNLIYSDLKAELQFNNEMSSENVEKFEKKVEKIKSKKIHAKYKPIFIGLIIFGAMLSLSLLLIMLLKLFTNNLDTIFDIKIIFEPPNTYGAIFTHYFDSIYLSLILTTTSLGIVFPIISELKLTETNYGLRILITTIVADFASLMCITAFITIYISGIAFQLLFLPMIFVIAFVIFHAMRILKQYPKLFDHATKKGHKFSETKFTGSIFLLLLFVVLSQLFGIEMILGAFLAGVLVSLSISPEESEDLFSKLRALGYGFTIPIFFITIGMNFRISEIFSSMTSIILSVIIIGIVFLIKVVPNTIYHAHYQCIKDGIRSGILQSSGLTLLIAAAKIGEEYFLLAPAINEILALTAIFTSIIGPIIFLHSEKRKKIKESCVN